MSPTAQRRPQTAPSRSATTCNSIFIDSSTITVWPACTASPSAASTATTLPIIGALSSLPITAVAADAASGGAASKRLVPRALFTSSEAPTANRRSSRRVSPHSSTCAPSVAADRQARRFTVACASAASAIWVKPCASGAEKCTAQFTPPAASITEGCGEGRGGPARVRQPLNSGCVHTPQSQRRRSRASHHSAAAATCSAGVSTRRATGCQRASIRRVCISPLRVSGQPSSSRRKPRLVVRPTTSQDASPADRRSSASMRLAPRLTSLAIIGS